MAGQKLAARGACSLLTRNNYSPERRDNRAAGRATTSRSASRSNLRDGRAPFRRREYHCRSSSGRSRLASPRTRCGGGRPLRAARRSPGHNIISMHFGRPLSVSFLFRLNGDGGGAKTNDRAGGRPAARRLQPPASSSFCSFVFSGLFARHPSRASSGGGGGERPTSSFRRLPAQAEPQ